MTEINQMQKEITQAYNGLSFAAVKTKDKFDARMRATVKDLLGARYALECKPVEVPQEVREFMDHLENAIRFGDAISGVNSDRLIQSMKYSEWNRNQPVRIYDYVQKIIDIFPAKHLMLLLHSSKNLSAVEFISLYEANKGEAKQSDYDGIPTGIDQNQIRYKATPIHKL